MKPRMTDTEWSDFHSQTYSAIRGMPLVLSSPLLVMIRTLEAYWIKYSTAYWLDQKQHQNSTRLKCELAYEDFEAAHKLFNLHYMRAKLMNG